MSLPALDLDLTLNPKFTYTSSVHWDELDSLGMLHNSRFAAHVERAIISWYYAQGGRWEANVEDNPDQHHVVRSMTIEFLAPVTSPGTMHIDIWVERLGTTSCTYGFSCSSTDGMITHARGERTIIRLDPHSKRPTPWTGLFRTRHQTLTKDLPAMP